MTTPHFLLRLVLSMVLAAAAFVFLSGVGRAHIIDDGDCHRHVNQPRNQHLNGCFDWHGRVCELSYITGASDQIFRDGMEFPRRGMVCE